MKSSHCDADIVNLKKYSSIIHIERSRTYQRDTAIMLLIEPPEIHEIETTEESGLFFRRLGEVAFSTPGNDTSKIESLSCVAVASEFGVVFFSDRTGKQ